LANETAPSSPSQNSGQPPGLLRTLFAAFSGVLFGLFLSKLKTPQQQSANSISPKEKSDDENDDRDKLSPFAAQIPPNKANSENACKCCHHKTPWWKITLEIGMLLATTGAFIAAAIYASVSHKMWVEMQTQTELSERPWINIVDVKTIGNNALIPALSFQGFGHGPFPSGINRPRFNSKSP